MTTQTIGDQGERGLAAIKSAFDSVGDILLNPDYVNAGFGDVVTINSSSPTCNRVTGCGTNG